MYSQNRKRVFLAILIPLFIALIPSISSVRADEAVSLTAFADANNLDLRWDPYLERGSLSRRGNSVTFELNTGFAVFNFRERFAVGKPFRDDGTVMVPAAFQNGVLDFFPEIPNLFSRRIAAIFIDPGHGGKDPGTIGTHTITGETLRLNEKDLVLDAALQLQETLSRRYPEKQIVVSRATDEYLTLEERTARANSIDAEQNESVIFISIHANASLNRQARGFEVWFLPPEVQRRDLVLAEQVGVDDPQVLSIINTIRDEEITMESVLLARSILSGLDETIGTLSPNRGLKEESWYVVRNAEMPSVLVELGFVTNEEEFILLRDENYLAEAVRGIYNGIVKFIRDFEQLGTTGDDE